MKKQNASKQKYPYSNFPDKFIAHEDTDKNELFHEKTFIGTELGGVGHRFRNYVVISTKNNQIFSIKEKQIVRDTFDGVCKKFDSNVEEIKFGKTYALIKVLVSIDVAIGKVIDNAIIACNKKGGFLRFHYFAINTKRPSKKDVEEYLHGIESL